MNEVHFEESPWATSLEGSAFSPLGVGLASRETPRGERGSRDPIQSPSGSAYTSSTSRKTSMDFKSTRPLTKV